MITCAKKRLIPAWELKISFDSVSMFVELSAFAQFKCDGELKVKARKRLGAFRDMQVMKVIRIIQYCTLCYITKLSKPA